MNASQLKSMATNNLKNAIAKALEIAELNNLDTLQNSLIGVSGRFNSLQRQESLGLISVSDANLTRNQILNAFLSFVNELERENVFGNTGSSQSSYYQPEPQPSAGPTVESLIATINKTTVQLKEIKEIFEIVFPDPFLHSTFKTVAKPWFDAEVAASWDGTSITPAQLIEFKKRLVEFVEGIAKEQVQSNFEDQSAAISQLLEMLTNAEKSGNALLKQRTVLEVTEALDYLSTAAKHPSVQRALKTVQQELSSPDSVRKARTLVENKLKDLEGASEAILKNTLDVLKESNIVFKLALNNYTIALNRAIIALKTALQEASRQTANDNWSGKL